MRAKRRERPREPRARARARSPPALSQARSRAASARTPTRPPRSSRARAPRARARCGRRAPHGRARAPRRAQSRALAAQRRRAARARRRRRRRPPRTRSRPRPAAVAYAAGRGRPTSSDANARIHAARARAARPRARGPHPPPAPLADPERSARRARARERRAGRLFPPERTRRCRPLPTALASLPHGQPRCPGLRTRLSPTHARPAPTRAPGTRDFRRGRADNDGPGATGSCSPCTGARRGRRARAPVAVERRPGARARVPPRYKCWSYRSSESRRIVSSTTPSGRPHFVRREHAAEGARLLGQQRARHGLRHPSIVEEHERDRRELEQREVEHGARDVTRLLGGSSSRRS